MTDTQIITLVTALQQGPYDIDEAFEVFILACIKKAGLGQPVVVGNNIEHSQATVGVQVQTTIKTKKLTGYNIFMKAKMAEYKNLDIPAGERMGKVSQAWGSLTDLQKKDWKDKASLEQPVIVNSKANPGKKGPKSLTGYQLFVQEKMPGVKIDVNVHLTDRLARIGELWKLMSAQQKVDYKNKANLISPPPK